MDSEKVVNAGDPKDENNGSLYHRKGLQEDVEIEKERVTLKQHVGLVGAISFVVGTIIGSGIFITPQGVLRNTGSVGLCMIVWSSGGLLSMLGALTYIELASVVRKSGGEYAFIYEAMGPIPAFIHVWSAQVARTPSSTAVTSLTFAEYLNSLIFTCGAPDIPRRLTAAAVIVTLAIVNTYSTKFSARVQVLFTAAKLIAVAIIVVGGIVKIGQGVTSELPSGFKDTTDSPSSIAISFYFIMFTYGGWGNVTYLIEEVKNPRRNVPMACIIGVVLTTVVYILANVSYLAVMTKQELFSSEAVALTWGEKVLGSASIIIPLSVLCSTFGASNGSVYSNTRIIFSAARDGNFPEFLSYVNVKRYTPDPSVIFHAVMALIMITQGSISTLISFLSFLSWFFNGLAAASAIILRFKRKNDPKRIKIPIVIPVLFLMVSVFLVVTPIALDPKLEYLYAALFCVGGLLFYFPFFHFNYKPKCVEKVEMNLQLLLEVAPSPYIPDKDIADEKAGKRDS